MILGPANILDCPFCGGEKEVMSLASGNTCGATVWSDTRRYYPCLLRFLPFRNVMNFSMLNCSMRLENLTNQNKSCSTTSQKKTNG